MDKTLNKIIVWSLKYLKIYVPNTLSWKGYVTTNTYRRSKPV